MMQAGAEEKDRFAADRAPAGPPLLALLHDPQGYLAWAAAGPLPVHHPIAALAVAAFVQILSMLVLRSPAAGFSAFALTAGVFILPAGKAAALLAASIAVHFFASAVAGPGGSGRGWRLFGLFLVCQLPFLFLLPAALIARLAGPWGWFPFFFLHAVVVFWSLWLMIAAVKENYAVSASRAVLAFLLPGLLLYAGSVAVFAAALFRVALLVA
jgi:hypothetical protein